MNASQIRPKAKKIAWALSLVYFSSYLTRINFAVMMVKIISELQVEKTALSIVVTGLTVTYGIGQVVSGFLGDRIKPHRLLTFGLALAAVCNITISFCQSIPAMTVVWCINGFAHAMLWPPIVRLMSMHLDDTEYGYAAVRVSWGSSFATILLYLVCPLLLYCMNWRTIMVLCGTFGLAVSILWTCFHRQLLNEPIQRSDTTETTAAQKAKLPHYIYLPMALIMTAIILQGSLRDGVTNWLPSFLTESFSLSEENAIITSVIPAIFSVISFALFDLLHRKLFRNEVVCAAVIFSGASLSGLLLFFIHTCFPSWLIPSVLFAAIIIGCMHGINLMLITVCPKRFAKLGKVSTYSGILNACTYIGAAVATPGFAAVAQTFGWNAVLLCWGVIAALGLLVCFIAASRWKRFKEE